MKKILLIKNSIVLFLLLSAASCKKLDLVPRDKFTDETYWTSPEKASTVLNTAYSQMFNTNYFFYNEGLSDNAYSGRGDQQGVATIAAGLADASLARFREQWNGHYSCIKTCNIFLENVDRVPSFDEATKNNRKAEARFIRAFQYFQLITLYGDVPLIEKDISVSESKTLRRTPRQQVLDFILRELDESAALLPTNTQYGADDRGRITKGAVIALKARVLLYEGRWNEVLEATGSLINGTSNGSYGLFNSYEGLFLPANESNQEVILDLQFVPEFKTHGFFFDMAPLAVGARTNALAPTQELVDDYIMVNGQAISESSSGYDEEEPYVNRDPRFANTIVYNGYSWKKPDGTSKTIYTKPGSDPDNSKLDEYAPGGVSSSTGYYIRKYYDPSSVGNFNSGLNLMLIRYADILLMHAEASNELGKLSEEDWTKTVRALRNRAGFTDPGALSYNSSWTQEQLRTIIRRERRTELAMEGLRYFDILRWKTGHEVLNGWAHGAKFGEPTIDNGYIRANDRSFDPQKHYRWPIPRDEKNLNPNLDQNNGW